MVEEERTPRGWGYGGAISTSLFTRDFLLRRGERGAYAQEIWRALKAEREKRGLKCGSYQSFRSNFWYVLQKLGLITFVREEPSSRPGLRPRRYYRIVEEKADSELWANPQGYLDERRRLGSRRYRKLKQAEV